MKLSQKVSAAHFILISLLILVVGLVSLAGIYYVLNIQYQKPKSLFVGGPVTTPPKSLTLNLDQPVDDFLTFQSSTIVSGQTAPLLEVLISTDTQDLVIKSKTDGSFSTVLNLDEGVNRITVAVFDTTGDSRSSERMVYYSKEKI